MIVNERRCYESKKVIGELASLYIDESFITYAEKKGFYVLGIGEHLL
ncbi:hypothetical protein ES705_50025 [subsurface metagenome]